MCQILPADFFDQAAPDLCRDDQADGPALRLFVRERRVRQRLCPVRKLRRQTVCVQDLSDGLRDIAGAESETAGGPCDGRHADGDGLPDSWEYAKYGSLSAKGIELLSETSAGETLVNMRLSGALDLRAGAKVPAAGLAAKLRNSLLGNAGVLALASGVPIDGEGSFADAISATVSEKLAADGVKITSLSFANGKVTIAVDVETEAADVDSVLISASDAGIPVKATVFWKQSLADTVWQVLGSKEFTTGSGEEEISVGEAGAGTSGFFKVVVEENK